MQNRIYLDNSATTRVEPEVALFMQDFLTGKFGNPSSMHSFGQEAHFALDTAREQIAATINCHVGEVVFTSGGTESDNWVIKGIVAKYYPELAKGKKIHIITTAYEHSAILSTCKYLAKEGAYNENLEFTYIKPDAQGYIQPSEVEKVIQDNTVLVSVMHINNEIGTINDIAAIGKICRCRQILFHTDAVQSFTKEPIDIQKMNIDLLSASSHKIHGPKGVGFLYIRRGVKIAPNHTGGHQEMNLRTGTENLPGIAAFGKSAVLAKVAYKNEKERIRQLKFRLFEAVKAEYPGLIVNGDLEKGYAGILNLTFPGIEGEALALSLDLEGIAVSTGSACSTGSITPSHVLLAIGLEPELAQSSIRLSISKNNTAEEIETTINALTKIIKRLKSLTGR